MGCVSCSELHVNLLSRLAMRVAESITINETTTHLQTTKEELLNARSLLHGPGKD